MPNLEHFFTLVPSDMHQLSGAVFNTGEAAFSQGAQPLYLLGINPGGTPEANRDETIVSHTREVLAKDRSWCGYRDEMWNGRPPGTSGMQPRIQHMFKRLSIPIDRVPMSNLVFERSRNVADLQGREGALAEACWPMHAAVLSKLHIRVVICLGGKCGTWVRKKVGAAIQVGRFVETYPGRHWASTAWRNSDGLNVVVVTHPSVTNWLDEAADPASLVASCLRD